MIEAMAEIKRFEDIEAWQRARQLVQAIYGGEVRSQLYVALDQNYWNEAQFRSISEQSIQISQLIAGFMRYLQQSDLRGSKYLRKSS